MNPYTSAPNIGDFSNADVDTIEDVVVIPVLPFETLWIAFTVGTAPLTEFQVQFRINQNSTYITIASAADDFLSPEGPVLGASGDLTIAGTTGTHFVKLDVSGVESVKVRAAGANSVVAGHWGAN